MRWWSCPKACCLLIRENTAVTLSEEKVFSALSGCDTQGGFFPLRVFLCRHVPETEVFLCAVTGTEDSWVGGNMCNHGRSFLQLPCQVLQEKTALLVVWCHRELPSAWEGTGFPAVGTGPNWVASPSSQCCTPPSVVRRTSAAGLCGTFL